MIKYNEATDRYEDVNPTQSDHPRQGVPDEKLFIRVQLQNDPNDRPPTEEELEYALNIIKEFGGTLEHDEKPEGQINELSVLIEDPRLNGFLICYDILYDQEMVELVKEQFNKDRSFSMEYRHLGQEDWWEKFWDNLS